MPGLRVTGSYGYNFICRLCGLQRKRSDIAKRWDGLMVCRDTCWEPRHPKDFYRTRNDTHKLDDISKEIIPAGSTMDGITSGFNPAWGNLGFGDNGLVTQPHGDYKDDTLSTNTRRLTAVVKIPFGESITLFFGNNPITFSIPSLPVTAGNYIFKTNRGRIISTGNIPLGSVFVSMTGTAISVRDDNLLLYAKYGI